MIERLARQFESEYRDGREPSLRDYLVRYGANQRLFAALLRIEISLKKEDEQNPKKEEYLEGFPDFAEAIKAEFDVDQLKPTKANEPGIFGEAFADHPVQIGPYKILQPIGEGGMGQVFMAEQTTPVKRRVALKIIKNDTPSKEILARFEAERQALAMMDHQNIAKVLDAALTDEGRPFFAMELVKGVPITEYCDRNKLNPNDRLELFVQTCRAIQHAHMKGIVHRDLKPSNILVTLYDGKPVAKVIDFGLAKALQDNNRLTDRTLFTQYGQVVGTLAYMSPEQAEMNALDVDTRTDVYSLGIILYELLTGSTPITKERLRSEAFDRVLAIIREEEAVRPSQRLSDSGEQIAGISDQRKMDPRRLELILKGDLDWIVVKALEKDRTRRYETPAALADDVQRFLNLESVEARPPSLGYRFGKAFRKHRTLFVAGGLTALVLVGGLIVTSGLYLYANRLAGENGELAQKNGRLANEYREESRKAKTAEADAREAKKSIELQQDELRSNLARSDYFLAMARWQAGRTADAYEFLERIDPEFQGFEYHLAKREFEGSQLTLYGHNASPNCIAYCPDGRTLASGEGNGSIILWDAVLGTLKSRIQARNSINSIHFSPDGRLLLTASRTGTVDVFDVDLGTCVQSLKHDKASNARFSSDGSLIASLGNGEIKVWRDGSEPRMTFEAGNYQSCLCFSPDGKQLAYGSGTRLRISDLISGEVERVLTDHDDNVQSVCYSPEGDLIATGDRASVRIWRAATGELVQKLEGNEKPVNCLLFSPDGTQLASGSDDGSLRTWSVTDGRQTKTLRGHRGQIRDLAFSPDGSRIASVGRSEKTVRLWDVTDPPEFRWLPKGKGEKRARWFYLANRDHILVSHALPPHAYGAKQSIQIIKTTTGETATELFGLVVAIDPHGRKLAILQDNQLQVLDGNGKNLCTLTSDRPKRRRGLFDRVYISPSGKYLIWFFSWGGANKSILGSLWDLTTGEQIRELDTDGLSGSVWSADFGSGDRFACSGELGAIACWDLSTGNRLFLLDQQDEEVAAIRFGPRGALLAVGRSTGPIELRDATSGRLRRTFREHKDRVSGLCFNRDGQRLASGSWDGSVRIWSCSGSSSSIQVINSGADDLVFGEDDLRIVTLRAYDLDNTVQLWDTATGEELRSAPVERNGWDRPRFTDDYDRVLFGIDGWDARPFEQFKLLGDHSDRVSGNVCFSPSGRQVAAGFVDGTVKIFDIENLSSRVLGLHKRSVVTVNFSPDGSQLASAGNEGTYIVWDVRTGREIVRIKEPEGHQNYAVKFNISGDRLLTMAAQRRAGYRYSSHAWDISSGRRLAPQETSEPPWTYKGSPRTVSPNGRWQAFSDGRNVVLADLEFPNRPTERVRRQRLTWRKMMWHLDQAVAAEEAENWFAATVHRGFYFYGVDHSSKAYQKLQSAHSQLAPDLANLLPQAVKAALKKPVTAH
ncbi:MAG: serine/threonine-protein kinase [Planctomycetota bacterium]